MNPAISSDDRTDFFRQAEKVIAQMNHSVEISLVDRIGKNRPGTEKIDIYKRSIEAIAQSDAIIAEVSDESFAVGYQMALAIEQKKPILLLQHKSAKSNPFIKGIKDAWVVRERYSSAESIKPIITKFLNDNDVHAKDMRFNFFIDRKIYSYLRWASFKTGKTKAEILRELIKREIDDQQ